MKTLLTGIATFVALASAVPVFASDVSADRASVDRGAQTRASTVLADSSRGADAKKPACACSCMK